MLSPFPSLLPILVPRKVATVKKSTTKSQVSPHLWDQNISIHHLFVIPHHPHLSTLPEEGQVRNCAKSWGGRRKHVLKNKEVTMGLRRHTHLSTLFPVCCTVCGQGACQSSSQYAGCLLRGNAFLFTWEREKLREETWHRAVGIRLICLEIH